MILVTKGKEVPILYLTVLLDKKRYQVCLSSVHRGIKTVFDLDTKMQKYQEGI